MAQPNVARLGGKEQLIGKGRIRVSGVLYNFGTARRHRPGRAWLARAQRRVRRAQPGRPAPDTGDLVSGVRFRWRALTRLTGPFLAGYASVIAAGLDLIGPVIWTSREAV